MPAINLSASLFVLLVEKYNAKVAYICMLTNYL